MKVLMRFWLFALLVVVSEGQAQTPDRQEAQVIEVQATVTAVTVYRGRAAVTRNGTSTLKAGLHNLRILDLPETIQPETLQARVSGSARVLEVQFDQESRASYSTPETEELDRLIDDLLGQLDALARQVELAELQEDLLAQVGIRAAGDATNEGGTQDLDLEVVKQQIQFVVTERMKLIEKRGELDIQKKDLNDELKAAQMRRLAIAGASEFMRLAEITVAVPEAGEITLELTYLVSNATWQPTYNIRAAGDGSAVDIEYDALLTQRTGEDWHGVDLTLSTAQPMLAANPPKLDPWYVDIRRRNPSPSAAAPRAPAMEAIDDFAKLRVDGQDLSGMALDAQVTGTGPAISYHLPRPVTIKTNIRKQQRSRITTVQTSGDFIHVAIPLLTEAVYIRGELTNASAFQLLPGKVSIFVDQDYIGPTQLASVAPNGTFKMYFGVDPAIKVRRTLLEKKTTKTGLLGGGLKTAYAYRLEIDNGTGKGIMLELWDRYPVSRNDQITIDLEDLSHPLATDLEYLEEFRPLGILKWSVGIPQAARGPAASVITYGVQINRAKNVDMTGLPE